MGAKASKNELVKVVETSGLEPQTSNYIKEKFLPFFERAEDWKRKAEALVVTDASQINEMKMARTARLALKEIRVNANKTRKALKEDSLRYGKAVQGVYNVIEYLIAPIENHLQNQEDFVVLQEAKRKAELKASREMELLPLAEFVPPGLNFGEMSEEDYCKILNGAKLQLHARVKAEAERIEKEKAEAEERERVRLENERLKAEAEAREKQLAEERARAEAERKALEEKAQKEKAAADAKLKAEREAREKLEAELKAEAERIVRAKREAEAKAAAELKAKQDAKRRAKAAPDKAKLNDFAKMLDELTLPEIKSEEAQKVLTDVKTLLSKVSNFIREKSSII